MVASALRGMSVYQDAYGFTTLRLFVDVFEGWLGFVVLAIMVAGVAGLGRWLPRVALVTGALGARRAGRRQPRRVGRRAATSTATRRPAASTCDYLQSLSADAAPVVVERLPEDVSRCVLQLLPYNSLRPRGAGRRSRVEPRTRTGRSDALARIDVAPLPRTADDECADVWAAFAE